MSEDFFSEVKRIIEDRNQKDHWDYAWMLMENARNFRDKARNWIQEELKQQRYYADFMASCTDGETKDRLTQTSKRIEEIDMTLLRQAVEELQKFIGVIESRHFPDPEVILVLYRKATTPIEDLVQELLVHRAFLDGMVEAYGDSHADHL